MIKNLLPAILTFIIFLSFLIYHHHNYFNLPEVKIEITRYTPWNLHQDHYIDYKINWSRTNCHQFENDICPKSDFGDPWSTHRFYISNIDFSNIEGKIRDNRNDFQLIFGYKKGKQPYAKRLLVNGKEIDPY